MNFVSKLYKIIIFYDKLFFYIIRWTLQGLNLWPTDYESVALTNWAKSPGSRSGTWTHTGITTQQILSLSCLPIPSSGLCDPTRIWTLNLQLRRLLLYPVELWDHKVMILSLRNLIHRIQLDVLLSTYDSFCKLASM